MIHINRLWGCSLYRILVFCFIFFIYYFSFCAAQKFEEYLNQDLENPEVMKELLTDIKKFFIQKKTGNERTNKLVLLSYNRFQSLFSKKIDSSKVELSEGEKNEFKNSLNILQKINFIEKDESAAFSTLFEKIFNLPSDYLSNSQPKPYKPSLKNNSRIIETAEVLKKEYEKILYKFENFKIQKIREVKLENKSYNLDEIYSFYNDKYVRFKDFLEFKICPVMDSVYDEELNKISFEQDRYSLKEDLDLEKEKIIKEVYRKLSDLYSKASSMHSSLKKELESLILDNLEKDISDIQKKKTECEAERLVKIYLAGVILTPVTIITLTLYINAKKRECANDIEKIRNNINLNKKEIERLIKIRSSFSQKYFPNWLKRIL